MTKKLVYISLLVGLSIILTRVLSIRIPMGNVEGVRIGFGGFPIIFGGIILGPVAGGIIGAIADLIGFFINPMGAYMPHFTLTSALTGIIPGFLFFYVFKKQYKIFYLILCVAVGQIITSVLLVPYLISVLFGAPFKVLFIPRAITQAIQIPIYAVMIKLIENRGLNLNFDHLKRAKNK